MNSCVPCPRIIEPRSRRRRVQSRRLAAVAFSAAFAITAVLLLLPGDTLPQMPLWDKAEHAATFAMLTILGHSAMERSRHRLLLVAGLIGFGILTEMLQTFVPGRSSEIADAVADAVGVLTVTTVWWLASRAWRSHTIEQLPCAPLGPLPTARKSGRPQM